MMAFREGCACVIPGACCGRLIPQALTWSDHRPTWPSEYQGALAAPCTGLPHVPQSWPSRALPAPELPAWGTNPWGGRHCSPAPGPQRRVGKHTEGWPCNSERAAGFAAQGGAGAICHRSRQGPRPPRQAQCRWAEMLQHRKPNG